MAIQEKKRAIIIKHDLSRGLSLKREQFSNPEPFDLIFLDPPYEKGLAVKSLTELDSSAFITSTTLVIAEESSGETFPDSLTRLTLLQKRRYGDTGFWFYTVAPS